MTTDRRAIQAARVLLIRGQFLPVDLQTRLLMAGVDLVAFERRHSN